MLSIDLTGNISDHMIRYAICRSVAEKKGYQWGINSVASHDYFGGKEQMYFFEDINYGLSIDTPYGQMPDGVNNIWEEKTEHYPDYDYHPYQQDIFDIPDWTKIVIYCGQDPRYFEKEKIEKWFAIKSEYVQLSEKTLKDNNIELDENLCIMNARGGEYIGIRSLFLNFDYWQHAMAQMLKINPKMKFAFVTEDPDFYRRYASCPVYHFGIATDYYIVNHAKNLILSNSGFGILPTWTNKNVQNIIAPRYWSRHNISTGYFPNSDIWRFGLEQGWKWMDREGGELHDEK